MRIIDVRPGLFAMPLLVAGATLFGATVSQAQKYPERPIRLIVPFPPGGQTDNVSRRLGDKITKILNQKLIVDNRGGASGSVGSAEAARAKPDGYTLIMVTSTTHAINPTAMSKISYDPVKDFAPVTVIATGPVALSIHPSVPAKTVKQFVADVKVHPGDYSYGSSGVGSSNHLAGELFKSRTGIKKMLHVPYRGSGPSVQELMGGQIPAAECRVTTFPQWPHTNAGSA